MTLYDDHDAFLCAAKGEPYTFEEWSNAVKRLEAELADAEKRAGRAAAAGVCLPARFEQ